MQARVRIGREFFAKIRKDYSNWVVATVREFLQNSLDARGTDRVTATTTAAAEGGVLLTIENNGEPMTEDILVNKLLTLGGSGKEFTGGVGGFGVAKSLLYMSNDHWTIRTGEFLVTGSGGEYDLQRGLEHFAGTRSEVRLEGCTTGSLLEAFRRFARYSQRPAVILEVNGQRLDMNLKKGKPRRRLGCGQIYTNRSFENTAIVRKDGMLMFATWTDFKGCVVLELDGASDQTLTSNRDWLKGEHASEFTAFLQDLAVDKKSALRSQEARYRHYAGGKLQHRVSQRVSVVTDIVGLDRIAAVAPVSASPDYNRLTAGERGAQQLVAALAGREDLAVPAPLPGEADALRVRGVEQTTVAAEAGPRATLEHDFVLKNLTGLEIPFYLLPEHELFGDYARKLIRYWALLLMELHELFGHEDRFSIGFVLDEEGTEAEYERGDYGRVYYLNPSVVVKQEASESRSFRKRFKLTERHRLLALAAHEFVHGAYNIDKHDEDFASRFTDVMAEVLKHAARFNKCFR